jgi:hypothetical protein
MKFSRILYIFPPISTNAVEDVSKQLVKDCEFDENLRSNIHVFFFQERT